MQTRTTGESPTPIESIVEQTVIPPHNAMVKCQNQFDYRERSKNTNDQQE